MTLVGISNTVKEEFCIGFSQVSVVQMVSFNFPHTVNAIAQLFLLRQDGKNYQLKVGTGINSVVYLR
jgi:hypothetical protein